MAAAAVAEPPASTVITPPPAPPHTPGGLSRGSGHPVDRRIETLVIFGAAGDLTARLLLPGVASYLASQRGKRSAADPASTATSAPITSGGWRCARRSAQSPSDLADDVAEQAIWMQGDVTQAADLERILAATSGRTALYFALPPAVTLKACEVLSTLERPDGLSLALEKPFGTDLDQRRAPESACSR